MAFVSTPSGRRYSTKRAPGVEQTLRPSTKVDARVHLPKEARVFTEDRLQGDFVLTTWLEQPEGRTVQSEPVDAEPQEAEPQLQLILDVPAQPLRRAEPKPPSEGPWVRFDDDWGRP